MIVLAGSTTGIVRGERGGGTWSVQWFLPDVDVRALAAGGDTLYAGADPDGVWRSDDGGETWRCVGLEGRRIRSLAVSNGRIYAGTKPPRVWVGSSETGRWTPCTPFAAWRSWFWRSPAEKPHTPYVQTLAVSPVDPDVVLAGIEAGALVRSGDGGRTWSGHRRGASRDPHVVAFHAVDGAWAYEGGGTGPAASRDGGLSWRKATAGSSRRYCWAAAADPAEPARWYVSATRGPRHAHGGGHAGAAVLRADRTGWTPVAADLAAMPYHLATPAPRKVVAVLASGDVRVSRDAGDSWERLPISLGPTRTAVVLDGS
jgi:hypothetical protein